MSEALSKYLKDDDEWVSDKHNNGKKEGMREDEAGLSGVVDCHSGIRRDLLAWGPAIQLCLLYKL